MVYVKKSTLYFVIFLVIGSVVAIGLLAGLLPQRCSAGPVDQPSIGKPTPTAKEPTSQPEPGRTTDSDAATTKAAPTTVAPDECQLDPTTPAKPWHAIRLPQNVRPTHYALTLWPNTTTDDFRGWETVDVNVTSPTKYLIIHFRPDEMTISNTQVTDDNDQMLDIESEFGYPCNQFYIVEMKNELSVGIYHWYMEFTGTLVGRIVGLYKSTYRTATGEERSLSTSKFQPTDSRRAFPNFDEPEFKARYTTTLIHDKDRHAMSNMDPEETVVRDDGYLETRFPITVPMSSYLTAYIVSDFVNTNTTYYSEVLNVTKPYRVWTHKDQLDQTLYALDKGKIMHEYFENEWFGVEFPLPKSDVVAVPDYPSGATEHWGIMTFRETNLLYEEGVSSEANKQRVAVVIAHELAHLWFGNLATCLWWNDLWLNEGFASYLEYHGVNVVHPDWLMHDQFLTSDLFYAMTQDQIVSSHPIIQPLEHPDQINEIFDSITYSKGSSIIRMLESLMGEEDFRAGIKEFMLKYKFGSVTTPDLWHVLNEHTYFNVPKVMDTWTLQMGYPVVSMEKFHDHTGEEKVRLKQKRFLIDPDVTDTTTSPYNYEWYVKFDYVSENGKEDFIWLDRGDAVFDWPEDGSSWIKANVDHTGVYRVNYDEETWIKLANQLKTDQSVFSAGNRAGLLNDAFNLARAGYVNYSISLDLSKYLENENAYIPWRTISSLFSDLGTFLYHTPAFGLWTQYVKKQVTNMYDRLGFLDEGEHLEKYLRGDIITMACDNGNKDCLNDALKYFQDWKDDKDIPSDFRSPVYKYGISAGSKDDWELMFEKYMNEQQASERSRLMYGLAQTRHVWLISRYLDYVWDENVVKNQDFFTVINYIANNPVATTIVWDWVRTNWQRMVDKFGLNHRLFGRLIPGITDTFTTELQLKEMKDFFELYPNAGTGARGREQALERVQGNINWLRRYEEEITRWLTNDSGA
ncbi:glutamyl aminopeptidase-like [Ptychodera flava]|uniref:glutamyl aminopeptidase-like n=1 Tax=Ptychodera flava TaxID=63121 RepID=UPI003969CAF5